MKKYAVHLKTNKQTKFYDAICYELIGDKYIFHKKEDKSDAESFALKDEVAGIDALQDGATVFEA